ncbi:GDP-fucose synthetase [Candidatus Endobugula sertula]|uniref:GDP-L-fucose synthase n=1 Tax=Candidatus Endobugula sertula TaxID=62101 RepID=A0A1D2QPM9_9GAMM|nr:GDP-fucose synthetase [Candidatus Endobugula sertula]
MNVNDRIYVAGHRGLVGSALIRWLQAAGYTNIIVKERSELDLLDADAVKRFFDEERPDNVILAAAKVGGIIANDTYPADFIYQNLLIQCNAIHSAYMSGIKKLLFLGSSCIYPQMAPQPIKEEYLLSGLLEPTNEAYAIAKIAGIKMCESYNRQFGTSYRSVMPTNLYGQGDNFNLQTSHVVPALIRKAHEAKVTNKKSIQVWGSGNVQRELLHVDDMADACMFIMGIDDEVYSQHTTAMGSHINVGFGEDISIRELASLVCEVVGFDGEINYDTDMPEGTPRKLLDSTKLRNMGWTPKYNLSEGLAVTYEWFVNNENKLRS